MLSLGNNLLLSLWNKDTQEKEQDNCCRICKVFLLKRKSYRDNGLIFSFYHSNIDYIFRMAMNKILGFKGTVAPD
jgi:hypothetical protein